MEKGVVMVNFSILMEVSMRGNGGRARCMDKVHFIIHQAV